MIFLVHNLTIHIDTFLSYFLSSIYYAFCIVIKSYKIRLQLLVLDCKVKSQRIFCKIWVQKVLGPNKNNSLSFTKRTRVSALKVDFYILNCFSRPNVSWNSNKCFSKLWSIWIISVDVTNWLKPTRIQHTLLSSGCAICISQIMNEQDVWRRAFILLFLSAFDVLRGSFDAGRAETTCIYIYHETCVCFAHISDSAAAIYGRVFSGN